MGKSAAALLLVELGVPTIDTDHLARQLTVPGSEALLEIASAFGAGVIDGMGKLDRAALADLVFSDPPALQRLEEILHPRIHRQWRRLVDQWRREGSSIGAVVIPLLFEKGYGKEFDATVAVCCTDSTQRTRLAGRGWSDSQAALRIAAQLPSEEKVRRADVMIWTEGSLALHREQWRRVVRSFGSAAA